MPLMNAGSSPAADLAEYFSDPLDPPRSLQLNNRYWSGETFTHLDALRAADDDIDNRRWASLRKTLQPVKALLPASFHRIFLSRLVYSIFYRVSFAPIRFTVKLSRSFIEANAYAGTEDHVSQDARHTEEVKYIQDLAHSIYRDKYGPDILSSAFAVRYMNSTNLTAITQMTSYGAFSNFHLDAGKDFTCIIYLCPVARENGCFSYIDGTSGVRKSHLLRALHQVVDMDMGLSNPEQTAALPLELRGGMGIGNYLDDEKRAVLQQAQVDVVGNAGDGIIFNGFDTLHRGGKPLKGERTALFISTQGHVNMRVKKYACDLMAYLWL